MRTLAALILALSLHACSQEKVDNKPELLQQPAQPPAASEIMLNDSQIRLANIKVQTVGSSIFNQSTPINARLSENTLLREAISSRASGRIEKLYFKEKGKTIRKGDPIYDLYSEDLLTLQNEYLLALAQYEALPSERYQSYVDAASKKLNLFGLTQKQIDYLKQTRKMQNTITFLAPSTGIINEILINEGAYVKEGEVLYQLADYSKLWVEVELYANEYQSLKTGDEISIRLPGESALQTLKIDFVSPEFRSGTQILVLRAVLHNPQLLYKVGMQAQVFIRQSAEQTLKIPVDAVVRDENGAYLFIQTSDFTFAPRIVKTGLESQEHIQIISGLNSGDKVVTSGAYLLYSDLILKNGSESLIHNHK